jgi:hypothetical protein
LPALPEHPAGAEVRGQPTGIARFRVLPASPMLD